MRASILRNLFNVNAIPSSLIVQYVAIYLYFRDKYKGDEAAPALDFPPYLLLNLLMAADYLQC